MEIHAPEKPILTLHGLQGSEPVRGRLRYALSAFSYGLHRDLAKAPPGELQALADKLREALGSLVLTGQTGKQLHDQYVKALAVE